MLQHLFMKGLLVAATKLEIAGPIKQLKKNADWGVLITGIGGVATAYALSKAIVVHKPSFLLQAGIAGCFSKQIALGAVIAIHSDCFGDLGVIEERKRKTVFDLGLMDFSQKPFKSGKLVNPNKKFLRLTGLPAVDAVSVNEITTRKADIEYYGKNLKAEVESMEGAAFHYAALMEQIPFLQIRSISNYVGERDKRRWNLELAIRNLNVEVLKIINELKIRNR